MDSNDKRTLDDLFASKNATELAEFSKIQANNLFIDSAMKALELGNRQMQVVIKHIDSIYEEQKNLLRRMLSQVREDKEEISELNKDIQKCSQFNDKQYAEVIVIIR